MKNKYLLLTLFFLFIYSHCFSQSAVCAYKYRKRITFDPAKVAGSADLNNFTALINISSDNDLRVTTSGGHVVSSSGFDILFTSDDGVTRLDHQLEKYTSSTGELVAWVRIPVLSTSVNTYIYMYYGNTAVTTDQSLISTWSVGYKAVWHFNNGSFADGTVQGNTAINGGSGSVASSIIAGGRSFPGTGTDYVQLPLSGASGGNANGSVSFWGYVTTFVASTYFIGESTTQTATYTNRLQIYIGDASGNLYLGLGGSHALQTNVQALSTNTWYHIALTWANTGSGVGTYSIFVNGVQKGSTTYSAWSGIHTFADMGNDGNVSQRTEEITGNMDEVRFTNTTLPASWITTEYNNQSSPSTFYSVSAEPKVWNGGSSILYTTSSNWLNSSVPASGDDVILNNGTFQPTLSGNVQVNGIFIRGSAVLSLATNNLSVRSDITNCGTITGGLGTVILNGGAATIQNQNLSGSGTYNLNDLTVNNIFATSPAVILNKDVNVSGDLTLTSGIVHTTAANILALGTSATSSSGSSSSFVSGPISKAGTANFVFPTGKGTKWRRTSLANITSSSTYRAEYFNSPYTNVTSVNSPLVDVSSLEYWQVDLLVGTGNANLALYWEDATGSGINNCADLTIARYNGSSWDERPGTASGLSSCSGTGTGTVTSTAVITAFSPFTFGSKSSALNPLPVELLEFKAGCSGDEILINWSTASEVKNDHFILERSNDGSSWTETARIKGSGTCNTRHDYDFKDTEVMNDLFYYRLSQVDLDGKKKRCEIISLNCGTSEECMLMYPNPASQELNFKLGLAQNYGSGKISIVDNLGRICFQQSIELQKGESVFTLPLSLTPGSYAVLFSSGHFMVPVRKLIVK